MIFRLLSDSKWFFVCLETNKCRSPVFFLTSLPSSSFFCGATQHVTHREKGLPADANPRKGVLSLRRWSRKYPRDSPALRLIGRVAGCASSLTHLPLVTSSRVRLHNYSHGDFTFYPNVLLKHFTQKPFTQPETKTNFSTALYVEYLRDRLNAEACALGKKKLV